MRCCLALILCLITHPAWGQKAYHKQDLIGAWQYVTAYTEFEDGRREPQFSEYPQGIFVIMRSGWYSHIIMSNDLPKVRSKRLKEMNLDEAEKIAEGVLAHFGRWDADEQTDKFIVKILWSSYPNFNGVTQTRTILELTKERLSYVNDKAVTAPGARAVATLRRLED